MKIVVVEDNLTMQKSIAKVFRDEGHFVQCFDDGIEAQKFLLVEKGAVDLAVVDYMLPSLDGMSLIKNLREVNIDIPILMLTARDSVHDKVAGLESGADYFLTKPFEFEELLACVSALRRRPHTYQTEVCEIQDGLTFDFHTHQIVSDGKVVALTPTESGILEYLVRNRSKTVSQYELSEHVFDFAKENWSNTIEVHIKNLRKKLERDNYENPIKTIRGVGYTIQ